MNDSNLRILQLCHKPPRPAVDGGCLAMDSLTQGLIHEGHHVKVLCLHTHKHPYRPEDLDATYLERTQFETVYAETELNLRDAASHVVTGESYHLSRFHVPRMERVVEKALRTHYYDVVILESMFMTSYIPAIRRLSDAEIVLRAHNVEHRIWEDVQGQLRGPKQWLLRFFQRKLKSAEVDILSRVDAVATITENDAAWFRTQENDSGMPSRVRSVPFGLDVERTPHSAMGQAPNHVLHLGAMDWTPNLQGVRWMLHEVWPDVRSRMPHTSLHLAGRNMPDEFQSQPDKGVNVVGEVADAQATYDTPCVVVVPLHAGSGMRIKLAEALAAGRPIVTTSKGMEGMDLVHGEHVLVGDTADTMAQWVVKLLQEPELAVRIGTQGRQWALDHLDHRARARELTTFLKTLVRA